MQGMLCSSACFFVLWQIATLEETTVNLGVQGLHPPVEELREAGELRDFLHLDALRCQELGRATAGEEFHPHQRQTFGKIRKTGLVGYREKRSLNAH